MKMLCIRILQIFKQYKKQNMQDNSLKKQFKKSKQLKKQRNKNKMTQQLPFTISEQKQTQIFNLFSKFVDNNRKKAIKNQIVKYYGKNYPINYKDMYDFDEQWQNKMFYDFKKLKSLVNDENYFEVILLVLTVISYSMTIWFSTIDFYFARQVTATFAKEMSSITLGIHSIRIIYIMKNKIFKQRRQTGLLRFAYQYKSLIIIFLYLLAKVCFDGKILETIKVFWLFQTISIIVMYFAAKKIYQSLRYMNFSLRYEYHTKIFDMIMTIFVIAHVIAIALYQTTKLNPQLNWLTHLNIKKEDYMVKYIYSFYFTTTTILTVGYGDISPKNPAEVVVITFVEIFGIVIFGYVLNEIGYCISSLKKNRQVIDKDLAIIQKIKKQYKMQTESVNKMVSFVINNKELNNKLKPEEEENILMKLNDEIRQDIMKENLSTIIKHSIFFLCRWSKYFQNTIALKLIHALYNPNEILSQVKHKQRIYLIKSGKINIHADRSDGKKKMGMLLKTIESNKEKQIYDNCYGYTAVISERPVNLYAIAKDFTSAYYVEKADFLDCTKGQTYDFEYFHEIKAKLDQSNITEAYEAQKLQNSRFHYNPSRVFLLKKHRGQKSGNERKWYDRAQKSLSRGKHYYEEMLATKIREIFVSSTKDLELSDSLEKTFDKKINNKISSMDNITKSKTDLFLKDMEKNSMDNFEYFFEAGKEYHNYFSKNNMTNIMKKHENEFFNLKEMPKTRDDVKM